MDIEQGVQDVLRRILDQEDLKISREMTAQDVEHWDSLANIQILVAIEKKFGIRFLTNEMVGISNIGEMLDLIQLKLTT